MGVKTRKKPRKNHTRTQRERGTRERERDVRNFSQQPLKGIPIEQESGFLMNRHPLPPLSPPPSTPSSYLPPSSISLSLPHRSGGGKASGWVLDEPHALPLVLDPQSPLPISLPLLSPSPSLTEVAVARPVVGFLMNRMLFRLSWIRISIASTTASIW